MTPALLHRLIVAVSDEVIAHADELTALRRQNPRRRPRDRLIHLVFQKRRQPGVASPIGAELADAEHPREEHRLPDVCIAQVNGR